MYPVEDVLNVLLLVKNALEELIDVLRVLLQSILIMSPIHVLISLLDSLKMIRKVFLVNVPLAAHRVLLISINNA
jgi:hypothetical protein